MNNKFDNIRNTYKEIIESKTIEIKILFKLTKLNFAKFLF